MPTSSVRLFLSAWLCFTSTHLIAQAVTATEATNSGATSNAVNNDSGPRGIVPQQNGFNASLIALGQHDSAAGWQSVLTPNVAYRFNQHFSANVGTPIFDYINITRLTGFTGTGRNLAPVYSTQLHHLLFGDTILEGTYETSFHPFDYTLTTSLGLPSGNSADGLGAGKVTYNFNNHVEHSFDWFTPDLEVGVGDNPNGLNDSRALKNFNATGFGAHFQAGAAVSLPHDINFESDAYEDLPLAAQTVRTISGKGRKAAEARLAEANSKGDGEDNGFLNALDIPLTRHITLSGIYNRSLRNHDDTAGMSLAFLLRPPPPCSDE